MTAETLSSLVVTGSLERSPYRGSHYKAELSVIPMARAEEYDSITLFEQGGGQPVRLSPSQRCMLLAELVAELRAHMPALTLILVRMYGPESVQLPRGLLAEDVFITHAPLELLPCLLGCGKRNLAVINHDLRSDVMEIGENTMSLWLLYLEGEAQRQQRAFLDASVVLAALARLETRFPAPHELRGLAGGAP